MYPPYKLTNKSIKLISDISSLTGKYEGLLLPKPAIKLRKQNKIKTLYGTLSIEGNTLSIEQITAIIEGKKILGPKKDILEVKNAITVYEDLSKYDFKSVKSLCHAHKLLMNNLVEHPGIFRSKNVGILKGSKVGHIAPQPTMLPKLIKNLFDYLNKKDEHPFVKSSVFHYEFEFIHPFSDGNGRVGRLWQSVILYNYNPIFEYIPIESVIKENQSDYYKALEKSDREGESSHFIEFMLEMIYIALKDFLDHLKTGTITTETRVEKAKEYFKNKTFTRKDYINFFKNISTATASRDLKYGTENKLIVKSGDKRTAVYRFKN